MSGRQDRARQLQSRRQPRKKIGMPTLETENGEAIEMSATSTIACIVFLLSIGASLATSYFLMRHPGCWGSSGMSSISGASGIIGDDVGSLRAPATSPVSRSQAQAQVLKISPKPVPVPAPPLPPVDISKCTADEMNTLKRQLPTGDCFGNPVHQGCSFTKATARGGIIHDTTTYYRSVIAQMTFKDGFTAVFTSLADIDDEPMDLLMLASHDPARYDVAKWRRAANVVNPAKPTVPLAATKNKAQVLILEPIMARALQAKSWKTATGLTDDDLKGQSMQLLARPAGDGPLKTLTEWAQTSAPGPIHYLRMGIGDSPRVMAGGAGADGALERVWYLEFGYDWKEEWDSASLEKIITQTLGSFSCYWQGGDGNLWRITGCWQSHYSQKHWSYVACVNVRNPDAKPIYDKMEAQFQATLKKPLNFA